MFGLVELDETYHGGQREMGQHGRSTTNATILGAVEDHDETVGELLLKHVDQATSATIDPLVQDTMDTDETLVKTDGWKAY